MKIKSVAGVVYYVMDIQKTVPFYKTLGVTFKRLEPTRATGYINWFWIDFIQVNDSRSALLQFEAQSRKKGAGQFLYLSVDNVDAVFKALQKKGMIRGGAPTDSPFGNREFILRDPDGYKIVVFQKK